MSNTNCMKRCGKLMNSRRREASRSKHTADTDASNSLSGGYATTKRTKNKAESEEMEKATAAAAITPLLPDTEQDREWPTKWRKVAR